VSLASTGCLVWLQRLQPGLAAIAVAALGYQAWLVLRLPARRRTLRVLAILWVSVGGSTLMALAWLWTSLRYR
jgi:hypothetical protein